MLSYPLRTQLVCCSSLLVNARCSPDLLFSFFLFGGGVFFQWIEGANLPLQRIWNSIQKDPRHHDIRVLADHAIPVRLFQDWHMQFAHRDCRAANYIDGLIQASDDVMDRLHDRPEDAPMILAEFSAMGGGPFSRMLVPEGE